MVVIKYRPGFLVDHVAVRSILFGRSSEVLGRIVQAGIHESSEAGVTWKIKAQEAIADKVEDHWELVESHLASSTSEIQRRNLVGRGRLELTLVLVDQQVSVDRIRGGRVTTSPSLTFYQFLDVKSPEALEYSLIQALGTIHHELVHFAARRQLLTFEGGSSRREALNEEIFAYIVQSCVNFMLLDRFHGARFRITIDLDRAVLANACQDRSALDVPSMAGRVISSDLLYYGLGQNSELSRDTLHLVLENCERISHKPQNFVSWIESPGTDDQLAFRERMRGRGVCIDGRK